MMPAGIADTATIPVESPGRTRLPSRVDREVFPGLQT